MLLPWVLVPSVGTVSSSIGIAQRNVPSSICLSELRSIPSRGEGVPPEAVLFHGQPDPCPSVGHGVSRAHQPERTHAGRHRRGDPLRAYDRDEVAPAAGGRPPPRRRTRARPPPPRPEGRVPAGP